MENSFLDLDTDAPESVLIVVAHPDDIDFGLAGSAAALSEAGTTVTYCLVTSGEAGAPEDRPRAEVAEVREREQRAAAKCVGVTDLRFLGLPDGHLVADLDLRRAIARVIREVKPTVVVSQSPERSWDSMYRSHPDHLAVGEATVSAVYPDARNPHAFVELLDAGHQPHAVQELWITALDPQDLFIDITDVIDRKIAALGCHESQLAHGRFDIATMLPDWAADTTKRNNLPEGRLTEAFRRISTQ